MRKFVTCEALIDNGIFANRMGVNRAIQSTGFPAPYRLGDRRVAWACDEVEAWVESRRGQPESHKVRK